MIRAVICDVYGTLLEVGPPPVDADARWTQLWHDQIGTPQPPSLRSLDRAVRRLIPGRHARGREQGRTQPEIDWPALAAEAFPDLNRLPATCRHAFFLEHARLSRSTRLAPGAGACLQACRAAGLVLGIASNAQASTLGELAAALAAASLDIAHFQPSVCFYSYQHGVAKPDPAVFKWLSARLDSLKIAPPETVMVGDRIDTDVVPARAAGWAAWHLCPDAGPSAGPWTSLQAWLATR